LVRTWLGTLFRECTRTALPPGSARDPAAAAEALERANNILERIKQVQIQTHVEAEVGMSKYRPPRHSPHL